MQRERQGERIQLVLLTARCHSATRRSITASDKDIPPRNEVNLVNNGFLVNPSPRQHPFVVFSPDLPVQSPRVQRVI